MAEVIGAVAAIAALVELSGKVLGSGYGYITKVIRAPVQLRQLLSEVACIDLLLNELADLATDPSGRYKSGLTSLTNGDRLVLCRTSLERISHVIRTCETDHGHGKLEIVKRRLLWPMKETETRELMQNLQRMRSYLESAVAIDTARTLQRVESISTEMARNLKAIQHSQTVTELTAWACPLDAGVTANFSVARDARHPGTGGWLMDGPDFQKWLSVGGKILWINGPPGSGKTVVSTTIIETLQQACKGTNSAVAYFYFDYSTSNQQSLDALLSRTIKQLLAANVTCIDHVQKLKNLNYKHSGNQPTMVDQINLLKQISREFDAVHVIVDALDEGAGTDEIISVIDCLTSLLASSDGQESPIRVLCTSRRLHFIKQKFDHVGCYDIRLDKHVHQDVATYIAERVHCELTKLMSANSTSDIKQQTIETIQERAGGLFLQAKHYLNLVSQAKSVKSLRAILRNLPSGLTGTYNSILRRIREEHTEHLTEIVRMLNWLSGCKIPVTLHMLAEVAAIDPGDTYLDPEAIWSNEEDLVLLLSGLVTVDHHEAASIIKFAHYTVEEHLRSPEIRDSTEALFYINEQANHQEMSRICLQYLSFTDFADADPVYASNFVLDSSDRATRFNMRSMHRFADDSSRSRKMVKTLQLREKVDLCKKLDTFALLEYAAEHWPYHAVQANMDAVTLKSLVPDISWLSDVEGKDPRFLSWRELHCASCLRPDDCEKDQPPLFFALLYGVSAWLDVLTESIPAPVWSQHFAGGWNPMTLAAATRSTLVVSHVLRHGAGVDEQADKDSKNHRTALHVATDLGDEDMVVFLLSQGACPLKCTSTGTTPLYRAARRGSLRILQLLCDSPLVSDVALYTNMSTYDGWTALIEAVEQGHGSCVDFLLDHGADPSIRNEAGYTALTTARAIGYRAIADLITSHPSFVKIQ